MRWRVDKGQIEVPDEAAVEALRGKTIAERVEMALAANRLVRLRIEGHLRTLHSDWDDGRIQAEIARRRRLGSDRPALRIPVGGADGLGGHLAGDTREVESAVPGIGLRNRPQQSGSFG